MNNINPRISVKKTKESLEAMSKEELVQEVIALQGKYNDLMEEWEDGFERQRNTTENILKQLGALSHGSFNRSVDGEKLSLLFDKLFCEEK